MSQEIRPVVRFSSGAPPYSAKRAFMAAFNAGTLDAAATVLEQRAEELTPFQRSNLTGLLAAERGHLEAAASAFDRAEALATCARDQAVVAENRSYLAMKGGAWEEARDLCLEGIRTCGTVEGLFVNLLAALGHMGDAKALGIVLDAIPELFRLDRGALRGHLLHDADLAGVRAHPKFAMVREKLASRGGADSL